MKSKLLFILLLFLYSCGSNRINPSGKNINPINIDYDYYLLKNNLVEFDIYSSIPYSELIFKKYRDGFVSNIVSSIKILDEGHKIIYSDSWSNDINSDFFENTQSSKKYINSHTIILEQSTSYYLFLEINDYNNQKHWYKNLTLKFERFEGLSDIKLFAKQGNIFNKLEYLEDDSLQDIDTVWVKYQILDDEIDHKGVTFNISDKTLDVNKEKTSVNISKAELSNYTINFLPIPLTKYSDGRIFIECIYKDNHKQRSIIIDGSKLVEYNYEQLIGPIEYILNSSDYIEFVDLDSTQKVDFIINYWALDKRKDLFKEFYSRVEYANKRFKNVIHAGSESDKGRIYIKYGAPNNIDYKFNQTGEFEIWTYHNKTFIFINRFGYYECYKC